jgi:isocitrate dehydrogenase
LDKTDRLTDAERVIVEADIAAVYESQPGLAMVDSRRGITNLHVPNDVIIDASMPNVVRDGGKMWNREDELQDTIAMVPDRSYATMYGEILEDCKRHGQFDPTTMGSVANVGLMAKKAEEYGSHDKTFEAPGSGIIRVVGEDSAVLIEQAVETGDIFRMCQAKDEAIRDWVGLAVRRARATASPAVFWLDAEREHDAQIIQKVNQYLPEHDTTGLSIEVLSPVEAMKYTLKRVRAGENTISVTGNVLRDYLTDLFPILELGTSARMLSIVPLLNGGGLFETGAGGSAPKHVQQFMKEGHLRWDSLGEYCALVPALEHVAEATQSARIALFAKTLDAAIANYLDEGRTPSRKVGELDNRGSSFYLSMYWARALAAQDEDSELRDRFVDIAAKLGENEKRIVQELLDSQGQPMDLGGYYHPDPIRVETAMRPSDTFNAIIETISGGLALPC